MVKGPVCTYAFFDKVTTLLDREIAFCTCSVILSVDRDGVKKYIYLLSSSLGSARSSVELWLSYSYESSIRGQGPTPE